MHMSLRGFSVLSLVILCKKTILSPTECPRSNITHLASSYMITIVTICESILLSSAFSTLLLKSVTIGWLSLYAIVKFCASLQFHSTERVQFHSIALQDVFLAEMNRLTPFLWCENCYEEISVLFLSVTAWHSGTTGGLPLPTNLQPKPQKRECEYCLMKTYSFFDVMHMVSVNCHLHLQTPFFTKTFLVQKLWNLHEPSYLGPACMTL